MKPVDFKGIEGFWRVLKMFLAGFSYFDFFSGIGQVWLSHFGRNGLPEMMIRKLLEQEKGITRDPDYGRMNHGITVVVL